MLFYLATPYSKNKSSPAESKESDIEDFNYNLAIIQTSHLLDLGYNIYCPVLHNHNLHRLKPRKWEIWIHQDMIMVDKCDGLILTPHWKNSKGCLLEFAKFRDQKKSILYYQDIAKIPLLKLNEPDIEF